MHDAGVCERSNLITRKGTQNCTARIINELITLNNNIG